MFSITMLVFMIRVAPCDLFLLIIEIDFYLLYFYFNTGAI